MLETLGIVVALVLGVAVIFALVPQWRQPLGRVARATFFGSLLLGIVAYSMLKAAILVPVRRLAS